MYREREREREIERERELNAYSIISIIIKRALQGGP